MEEKALFLSDINLSRDLMRQDQTAITEAIHQAERPELLDPELSRGRFRTPNPQTEEPRNPPAFMLVPHGPNASESCDRSCSAKNRFWCRDLLTSACWSPI